MGERIADAGSLSHLAFASFSVAFGEPRFWRAKRGSFAE